MTNMLWQTVADTSCLLAADRFSWGRFIDAAWSEWLILGIAVLAVLIVFAGYVITKIRSKPAQKEHQASEWLSKYTELHSKGGLSDEEFRTIKTKLAERLQDELKDNGENG
jgi:uncharacterized membrane protein